MPILDWIDLIHCGTNNVECWPKMKKQLVHITSTPKGIVGLDLKDENMMAQQPILIGWSGRLVNQRPVFWWEIVILSQI